MQLEDITSHYVRTLNAWRANFLAAEGEVERLGYDQRFRRLWNLYLAYCEAGFRSGYLGVSQLQMTRGPAWI